MSTTRSGKAGEKSVSESGSVATDRPEGHRDAWTRVTVDRFYRDANSDLEAWLFRVESIAKLEGWTNERQLQQAIVALAGTALSEYRASAVAPAKMTWKMFVDTMRKRFGPSNPIAYWNQKLVSIRQGLTETVAQYSGRFRHALGQLSAQSSGEQPQRLPEQTAVTWYHEGLLPVLQAELERDQPRTLQQAVDSALKAERVQSRLRSQRITTGGDTCVNTVNELKPRRFGETASEFKPQQPDEAVQLRELIAKQGQMMERMMGCIQNLMTRETKQSDSGFQPGPPTTQNVNSSRGMFRGVCFRCNTPGHRAAECRKRWPINQGPTLPQNKDQTAAGVDVQPTADQVSGNVDPPPDGTSQQVMRVAVDPGRFDLTSSTMPDESGVLPAISPAKETTSASVTKRGISSTMLVVEGARPTTCILDSEAEVCIVAEDFLASVGKSPDPIAHHATGNLIGASGAKLQAVGSVYLDMSVGNNLLKHKFVVVKEFPYPVLLGTDFLSRVGAVIDFRKGSVTLGEESDADNHVSLPIRQLVTDREGEWLPELSGTTGRACVLTSADTQPVTLSPVPEQEVSDTTTGAQTGEQQQAASDGDVADIVSPKAGPIEKPPPSDAMSTWKPSESVDLEEGLDTEQRVQLCTLIDAYSDLFSANTHDMGRTWVATHRIPTGDSLPVNSPPYRVSPAERETINQQVQQMLADGVIQESESAWASPVVLVDKRTVQRGSVWTTDG